MLHIQTNAAKSLDKFILFFDGDIIIIYELRLLQQLLVLAYRTGSTSKYILIIIVLEIHSSFDFLYRTNVISISSGGFFPTVFMRMGHQFHLLLNVEKLYSGRPATNRLRILNRIRNDLFFTEHRFLQ